MRAELGLPGSAAIAAVAGGLLSQDIDSTIGSANDSEFPRLLLLFHEYRRRHHGLLDGARARLVGAASAAIRAGYTSVR